MLYIQCHVKPVFLTVNRFILILKKKQIGLGHFVDAQKSQCSSMSDGESFEGFGENDAPDGSIPSGTINGVAGVSVNGGVDLELIPHIGSTPSA